VRVGKQAPPAGIKEEHAVSLNIWLRITGIVIVVAALLAGCATPPPTAVQPPAIRVGVVRDFPPFVLRTGDAYSGAEVDFARLLGAALGRPIKFVERGFDDQVPALLAQETDIIMTGMTITDERKMRISFSDYYLKSGLALAVRADQAAELNSLQNVLNNAQVVGVIGGTTGEAYVRRTFPPSIRVLLLGKPSDAPFELKNRRIDAYVDDAPSVAWLVSSNAAEIRGLFEPLGVAYYGWGISKDNTALLAQVNALLGVWRKDGTLDGILDRWLPYLKAYR
jgi:polar amino acid transport system substrate-binding protein